MKGTVFLTYSRSFEGRNWLFYAFVLQLMLFLLCMPKQYYCLLERLILPQAQQT